MKFITVGLVWIYALFVCAYSKEEIVFTCNANCGEETDDSIQFSCTETHYDDIGCEDEQNSTSVSAPAPRHVNTSLYLFGDGNEIKRLAFNVTWYQESYKVMQFTKGYAIRFTQGGGVAETKKLFFSKKWSKAENVKYANKTFCFNYRCYGMNESVSPDELYRIQVSGLPEACSDFTSTDESIATPDCDESPAKESKNCIDENFSLTTSPEATTSTSPKVHAPNHLIRNGFIIGSLSAIILVLLVILLYKILIQNRQVKLVRVLVIADLRNNTSNDQVQNLCCHLNQFCCVVSCLWSRNDIEAENSTWIVDNINTANCLIFFAPTQSNETTQLLNSYDEAIWRTRLVIHETKQFGVYISEEDRAMLPKFIETQNIYEVSNFMTESKNIISNVNV